MAGKPLPDARVLHKFLRYERESGKLFWKYRPLAMFAHSEDAYRVWKGWNAHYAEKEAFCHLRAKDGYLQGGFFNEIYLTHRVIWTMFTGQQIGFYVRHENKDRQDNRIQNLRGRNGGCWLPFNDPRVPNLILRRKRTQTPSLEMGTPASF